MTSSASELQKAIFAKLASNAQLSVALGVNRIFDHVPVNMSFPYLLFGRTTISDWSTDTEDGCEHIITIHTWSKARGKLQTLTIMEAVRDCLHEVDLALEGHRLVNLRCEFEEIRHDDDLGAYHGMTRFRVVTEPVI